MVDYYLPGLLARAAAGLAVARTRTCRSHYSEVDGLGHPALVRSHVFEPFAENLRGRGGMYVLPRLEGRDKVLRLRSDGAIIPSSIWE